MSTSSSYTKRNKDDYLFQVRIDPSKFTSWECLQSNFPRNKAHDCVINAYHFLGIITDRYEAEQLASLKNLKAEGTTHFERLELIYKYLTSAKMRQETYEVPLITRTDNPYSEWVAYFKSVLKPNYATMINLYPPSGIGHTILVYMDQNRQLYLVDPQKLRIFISDSQDAIKMLANFDKMNIIMKKPKKGRLTTLSSFEENPVKKRRVTNINKSNLKINIVLPTKRNTQKRQQLVTNKRNQSRRTQQLVTNKRNQSRRTQRRKRSSSHLSKPRRKKRSSKSAFAPMEISSSNKRTSSAVIPMDISV